MRRDRYIATICRSLEISRTAADKRASDDTANIRWFNEFKGDLANLVQPIQTQNALRGRQSETRYRPKYSQIGMPVLMCSSPSSAMIVVPDA